MPKGRMPLAEGAVEAVACPKCQADVGEPCRSRRKTYRSVVHQARRDAMEEQEPRAALADIKDGHEALSWVGWRVYTDTGRTYRRWRFKRAVPAVGADEGDHLDDPGPGRRFQVRRKGGEVVDSYSAEDLAAPFFLGAVPEWNPPAGADLALLDAIKSLGSALEKLTASVQTNTLAFASSKASGTTSSPQKKEEPKDTPENQYLRFVREGEWSNTGESFRIWELKVDVPELGIQESFGVSGKAHAQVGDHLWEQKGDELTPFRLKRDDRRIASPEWWQVRHLFEGLREEDGAGGEGPTWGLPPDTPGGRALASVLPGGRLAKGRKTGRKEKTSWGGEVDEVEYNGGKINGGAWYVTADVAGTDITAGSILLHSGSAWSDGDMALIRGIARRCPRRLFKALHENRNALRFVDASPRVYGGSRRVEAPDELDAYVRQGRCQSGKTSSSRVLIVRPVMEQVSRPIPATSDEAAIFELIHSTGGRMPGED